MPHKRLKPEYNFNEDQLRSLKQIVPEAFSDGQINWEILKEALGEYLEEDGPDSEHFGLFWPGKKQTRRLAGIPSKGTLVPVYGKGLKADGTLDKEGINDSHNIFIEGENLEVLKILQKSYAGRIKMIYIDPPYNTGNDFIYEDDFTEPLKEYLRRTGQVDEEGRPLTTNTRADGRFHSKWLSMMYPRLRLSSNLLRDDGVIFVSIDDNEMPHLRSIMNEIFGEENFIANLIWANKEGGGGSDSIYFRIKHEYILCYAKNILNATINGIDISNLERYTLKDEFYDIRGPYYLQKLNQASIQYSKSLDYPIQSPEGDTLYPKQENKRACWRWSESKFKWGLENKFIEFRKDKNEKWQVYTKQYLKVDNNNNPIIRTNRPMGIIDNYSSTQASKELEEILGPSIFPYSKPAKLVQYLIGLVCSDNDIILDFFSGSGTTGQAVIDFDKQNDCRHNFLLVQMSEPCEESSEAFKSGYHNIAEIAKERICRVVKKLNDVSNKDKNTKQHKIDIREDSNEVNPDYGFKVFKLQESNYKIWKNYYGTETRELEDLFDNSQSPLVDNWKPEKLLAEILLIEGFPLDSKLEHVTGIKKNKVTRVTSGFHEHSLLFCLDSEIAGETIKQLNLTGDDIFICLDNAVTDQDKVRLADKGMIKTI